MSKEVLLVVDMIDQFVYGDWPNSFAQAIVQNIVDLAELMRSRGAEVICARDSHFPQDHEIKLWGKHAMSGTLGSELIPELKSLCNLEIKKRSYDAFYETTLHNHLRNCKVNTVVLAGVLTNICVRHTAAGAFMRGYGIIIPKDCVAVQDSLSDEEASKLQASEFHTMETLYGATIVESWREV